MKKLTVLTILTIAGSMLIAAAPCSADALTVSYFTMNSSDPDVGNGGDYTVATTLGPNGLPVWTGGQQLNDLNGSNEIEWWAPSFDSFITATGTGSLTVPFDVSMYTPNGTGSSDGGTNGFQAAVLTGNFSVTSPEQVTFDLGSDDDSFLYVDGSLVAAIPGIHGDSSTSYTTSQLGVGDHSLVLFYTDREPVGAELSLSIETQGLGVTGGDPFTAGTPEPGTLLLLGSGMLALGRFTRRKLATSAKN